MSAVSKLVHKFSSAAPKALPVTAEELDTLLREATEADIYMVSTTADLTAEQDALLRARARELRVPR